MKIICTDGRSLDSDLTLSQGNNQGTVVIAGATGVRRSFYQPIAEFLATQGWNVLRFDFRGIGGSRGENFKQEMIGMRDWGQHDIEAVICHAAKLQGNWDEVILVGHSSGAHLSPLAPSFQKITRAVFIASGTCYWKLYPIKEQPKLLLAWGLLWPLLLKMYGYLPRWAGVGAELPQGVAREWSRWGISKGYLFADNTLDTTGYAKWPGEIFAISFTDDLAYSPPATVRDLLVKFKSATANHRVIDPSRETGAISHFGFFNNTHKALWPHLLVALNSSSKPKNESPSCMNPSPD